MGKSVGIDLGTTNSVVAVSMGGDVQVLLNLSNDRYTPSVVGKHKDTGQELVGARAVDHAARNPQNTVFSIKRLMGRFWDDENVQTMLTRYDYRIVKASDGSADVRVMFGDEELTPTDISAKIVRKIKEDAEARLGEEVSHAVITVPAYFSNLQRICTRKAGQEAGLKVKAIIDEPTAAAIAFGLGQHHGDPMTVLVYDLGGGTFDVAVLTMAGDYAFNQMNIEGNMWLGGDDFDHKIMDYVLERIRQEHHVDPSEDRSFKLILKRAAEKAKIDLGEMSATSIVLFGAFKDASGERPDVEVGITRSQFDDMIREDISGLDEKRQALGLVRKALRGAGISADAVDHVLLVGGSTSIPLVQRTLAEQFGESKLMRNIDPMTCVAVGAAVLAERLEGLLCTRRECQHFNPMDAEKCEVCGEPLQHRRICNRCGRESDLSADRCAGCGMEFRPTIAEGGITAKAIGIQTEGGQYAIIIPKSTPYPTTKPVVSTFRTASDTQVSVLVPLYHGDDMSSAAANEFLGAADIPLEGEHLPAGTLVDVSIGIDGSGCLHIEAIIQDGSGRRRVVEINPAIGSDGTSPKVGGARPRAEAPAEAEAAVSEWEGRLRWSLAQAKIALQDYEWFPTMDPRQTQKLRRLMDEGERALEQKDEATGRIKEKEIDAALESIFGGAMWVLVCEIYIRFFDIEPGLRSELASLLKEVTDSIRPGGRQLEKSVIQAKIDKIHQLIDQAREQIKEGAKRKGDRGKSTSLKPHDLGGPKL